jgi:hypothetical protein
VSNEQQISHGLPPLEYAPAPSKRRKIARRLIVLLLLVAVAAPLLYWRKPIFRQARLLYWQRQCLRYTAPPDQVVYEENEYKPSPLLGRPGYVGWPVSLPPNVGSPNGPLPPAIATLPAPPLASFFTAGGFPPAYVAPPQGATVFLHERTGRTGRRQLVIVTRFPVHDVPFMYAFGLNVMLIGPAGIASGPTHQYPPPVAFSWLSDMTRPPTDGLRLYAGQPDPADPSRFTIRYDLSGRSGEIEGRLKDDGQGVSLRITSGPAIGTKWQTDVLFKD